MSVCHPHLAPPCCTDTGPDSLLASTGPDSVTSILSPTHPTPLIERVGRTVCEIFAIYCDIEMGFGVTQGHRNWHYSIEHIPLYIRLP